MVAALGPAVALAQAACDRDAMLVFDGSGSMAETGFNQLDEPRIHAARRAMHRALPRAAAGRRVGLIIYGPADPDGCASVDLRFEPRRDAAPEILAQIDALQPDGNTPLTASVARGAEVLEDDGTVVLVTDGKETCGGAPCELAWDLAAQRPGVTVHVIGFQVRSDHFIYRNSDQAEASKGSTIARCLADRTGGEYFPAESAEDLAQALDVVLGCPVLSRAGPRATEAPRPVAAPGAGRPPDPRTGRS